MTHLQTQYEIQNTILRDRSLFMPGGGVLEEIKGGVGLWNFSGLTRGGGLREKLSVWGAGVVVGGGALKIRIYKSVTSFWRASPPRPPLL